MKNKLIVPAAALLFFACGQSKQNNEAEERNSKEHIESTTEENRSPNLENKNDTGSRLFVDTVSSAESIEKKKENDSLGLDTRD